jgi:hypothetical protein
MTCMPIPPGINSISHKFSGIICLKFKVLHFLYRHSELKYVSSFYVWLRWLLMKFNILSYSDLGSKRYATISTFLIQYVLINSYRHGPLITIKEPGIRIPSFTTSINIPRNNSAYNWFCRWLAHYIEDTGW